MKQPDDPNTQPTPESGQPNATPGGRREIRDHEYRQRILSAARTLLTTQDLESVTMHQIAKESGVGQGTLYRRYPHIGDICSDLIKSTTQQFVGEMEERYGSLGPDDRGLAVLETCLRDFITFVDKHVSPLAMISSMHAADKRHHTILQKPFFVRLHGLIVPLLERAVAQGDIEPLDVTLTANIILLSLMPEPYLFHKNNLGYTKESFIDGICRLFVKGL
ncbi:TetR/AcrR family transcriptional regulator [Paenibacillus oryzisoli]|uniref:TetR/AcrR family transcriptional regulator n=1 Tax=Paenibacillus oryzisoli TaxID=1850517 RepID=UPI003D2AD83E